MEIIGLWGYAQAGKDTVGKILVARGYKRVAFADKVRAFALAINPIVGFTEYREEGIDDHTFTVTTGPQRLDDLVGGVGWEAAKQRAEVRGLLQRIGTDAGRRIMGSDVWVDLAFDGLDESDAVVATDVRFANEAHAIQARGGLMVKVTRPGTEPVNAHVSETGLESWPFDWTIVNDDSIQALEEKVTDFMSWHQGEL